MVNVPGANRLQEWAKASALALVLLCGACQWLLGIESNPAIVGEASVDGSTPVGDAKGADTSVNAPDAAMRDAREDTSPSADVGPPEAPPGEAEASWLDASEEDAAAALITPVAASYVVVGVPTLTTLYGYAWAGKYVVVMTPASTTASLDPATMTTLVASLDKIWSYYLDATGQAPFPDSDDTYNGLDVIGVVPDDTPICGIACSNIGANGTSILDQYFGTLYSEIGSGSLDQVLPYEFGRNFWFYGNQLGYTANDPVMTGFAVFMRFQSMNVERIPGGPFNGRPFSQFQSDVEGLVDVYESDAASYTWQSTLGSPTGVTFAVDGGQTYGASDLLASILFRLMKHYGGDAFASHFWRAAASQPAAASTPDAVDNFVIAASLAAAANLTGEFTGEFRWPVSSTAAQKAQMLFGNPVAQQP